MRSDSSCRAGGATWRRPTETTLMGRYYDDVKGSQIADMRGKKLHVLCHTYDVVVKEREDSMNRIACCKLEVGVALIY